MQGLNVLVVEDDQEAAEKLKVILKPLKYRYWVVSNREEVLNMLKTTSFGVVLTELRMPYMNGIEVVKTVLGISPATRVVVMTAYSFISFAVEAMEAGADAYITKPFNPLEIKIVTERAFERYHMILREDKKEYYLGLSVKDGLTGVYNRRFLDVQLKNKISKSGEGISEAFSLIMTDVDNFKKYNDTKGHQAGDNLLCELAKLFQDSLRLREGDTVFRYGGEEFCILLNGISKQESVMVAERIRTMVELYLQVTISMGVSSFPEDAKTEKDLIKKADDAMYKAKTTGKNKVVKA
ncbi:MAG: diguanylate cyclase [Candidatus Omnitrophica bacterium]|nr:diguanylate cyclase [Candidatus Omnitrophota bacterium]